MTCRREGGTVGDEPTNNDTHTHTHTHLRDAKVVLCKSHCICDILQTVVGVERGMVWDETWFAVVHES